MIRFVVGVVDVVNDVDGVVVVVVVVVLCVVLSCRVKLSWSQRCLLRNPPREKPGPNRWGLSQIRKVIWRSPQRPSSIVSQR